MNETSSVFGVWIVRGNHGPSQFAQCLAMPRKCSRKFLKSRRNPSFFAVLFKPRPEICQTRQGVNEISLFAIHFLWDTFSLNAFIIALYLKEIFISVSTLLCWGCAGTINPSLVDQFYGVKCPRSFLRNPEYPGIIKIPAFFGTYECRGYFLIFRGPSINEQFWAGFGGQPKIG